MSPTAFGQKLRRSAGYYWNQHFYEKLLGESLFPLCAPLAYPARDARPPPAGAARSVLVWNVDSLGDSLWITPLLRALREGLHSARISLVCNRAVAGIFETNPCVDVLLPIEAEPFYGAAGYFRAVPGLAAERFDAMLIVEMGSRPADRARLLGRKLGIPYIVSSNVGLLKSLPDHLLPPNGVAGGLSTYWPEYFLAAGAPLGLPPSAPRRLKLEVHCTPADDERAAAAFREWRRPGEPLIVFHPGVAPYAGLTKKWPRAHFVRLAAELRQTQRARFILTGSRDDREECAQLAADIEAAAGAGSAVSAAGRFEPRELVAFLKTVAVAVVPDSAILHLALAAGTPVVALFGATDPALIAPRSPNCVVLTEELPCRPCHHPRDTAPFWPTCVFSSPHCLEQLSPSRVAREVTRLLEGAPT